MRNMISSYTPLSRAEKLSLWNDPNTVFVFDTNVLLDLYRLSAGASDKQIKNIKSLNSRVWIPFHVANEYAKNRCGVIFKTMLTLKKALALFFHNVNQHYERKERKNQFVHLKNTYQSGLYGSNQKMFVCKIHKTMLYSLCSLKFSKERSVKNIPLQNSMN